MDKHKDFLDQPWDERDPDPWLALYLDQSTPLPDAVKAAWLRDCSSSSRQYLLPFLRPLARLSIIAIQILKVVLPKRWAHSRLLHKVLAFSMNTFVSPEANWLIMRHFHLGSHILAFVAANAPTPVKTAPIEPACIDDIKDELFLKHDLNLFNFVIRLNQALRAEGKELGPVAEPDFTMVTEPTLRLEDMPRGPFNKLDLQSAIEVYTPVYQLLLTDHDFWRASNSLQLDETLAIYCAKILATPEHLVMLNNKHPLVPLSTLRAGHRLVLHGLSTEMLHCLLMRMASGEQPVPAREIARMQRVVETVSGPVP
ncbi:hypothetical protein IB233_07330 [Comamonas sp. CMM01]|jgi:hypothetical protein|uniref:DUF6999 family protein n=1 Tax=Comamonas TaxID=283 RepID=UPI001781BB66|nr:MULTISPECIES: hypothetical protein [Comamonas]MBD9531422.1 hypothetical protein [Comamonas sp. CMM01]MBV7417406.1 hypothetical protein [Comamonas sp. CMM03]MDI9853710.1 hypothetical protein [Comamonas sp. 17RB]